MRARWTTSVTGVGSSDFAAAASGLSGAAVTNVTGSGTTYTVTLSSGTGNGTLGLNLVDDDSIIDAATNPLGGTGLGNGNFTGQTYTVNRAPSCPVIVSAQTAPGTSPTIATGTKCSVRPCVALSIRTWRVAPTSDANRLCKAASPLARSRF